MTEKTEDVQILKRKRASLKSKLTIFKLYINEQKDKTLDEDDTIEIEERIAKFKPLIDEFDEIQGKIDDLLNNADSEFEQRQEFDKIYYATLAAAKKLVVNCNKLPNQSNSTNSNSKSNGIKLPVIELGKFTGNYESWLEYRDTFRSLIHENEDITDVQKFHYLRSSLTGSATQVIQSLEFTSANYTIAWDLLCKRFDNSRLLVHNHVKALFNLEVINKESSGKIRKLIDSVLKHLRALKQLGQKSDCWDTLIIYLIATKLDKITVREWEEYKADNEIPSLENMFQFLRSRADLLETLEVGHTDKVADSKTKSNARSLVSTRDSCYICSGEHLIGDCKEFGKLSVGERSTKAKAAKLCLNCLKKGHFASYCRARGCCKKCRSRHHTLLHHDNLASGSNSEATQNLPVAESVSLTVNVPREQVLLSTACILVHDINNKPHKIRALLDCGSQSSFVTIKTWQMLQLKVERANLAVSGLSDIISHCENKCTIRISSNRGVFISKLTCYVLPKITADLPNFEFNAINLHIPQNITLADPEFNVPGPIDLLIGADLFWELIGVGQIKSGPTGPILQKTKLGWVISGPIGVNPTNNAQCNLSRHIEAQITKFWELEEFPDEKPQSQEEIAFESHFTETTTRDENGRFVVTIPFKRSISNLGESLSQAKRRFYSLEKRLQANPDLKREYVEFINEYEALGHMGKITENTSVSPSSFYMPHHGVIRASSTTTKLRVVFDGSARSNSGLSINDLQMVGPVIQNDLLSIILRFRKHSYVVSSDIEKMYRQVLTKPTQRPLQRILWRSDPQDPLEIFELNTVTYGTACASFLAIRCLFQLALECEATLPKVAQIIKNDFYVDDLITGAETVQELARSCKQIVDVLQNGCFTLRKWVSNNPQALELVSNSDTHAAVRELVSRDHNNTLGLSWSPTEDVLLYKINASFYSNSVTKRTILSAIAQIFDPLGLLSPCIITAKIILQKLWEEKLSWDQSVPPHIHSKWLRFKDKLPTLNELRIPRHAICKQRARVEIHGFSDASEEAYGACIYLRSINSEGNVRVELLCAKTKVAPLKKATIPRLELCGSLVLARLLNKVTASLHIEYDLIVLWCDSTIVLGWLNTSPNLLKTFVGNRVAKIQALTTKAIWNHVPTKDNPADLLSRGVCPSQLQNLDIWWHGPNWLSECRDHWPNTIPRIEDLPEVCNNVSSLVVAKAKFILAENFSNLSRLQRTVAYCLRFAKNCRLPRDQRNLGPLIVSELQAALISLVKLDQLTSFFTELVELHRDKEVSPKSRLLRLNPFLDAQGVIRIGGRLSNSNYDFNKKHPIVLDGRSYLTKLILRNEHKILLHAGPQLILSSLRERFWPIAGRNAAKKIVHDCVRCFRTNPKVSNPLMGSLPVSRITSSFPFVNVGVDYAGPIFTKDRNGRGCKTSKSYISLFVCFATKAVHLELVTDLTTDAFILAFRRFISRRGKPENVYSDNGTNFIGARNMLHDLGKFLVDSGDPLREVFQNEQITWHFIPAQSPHFGGIWESGVKSVKHHLKRVVGNALLTYEQMYTLLVQIEAILNSRPLSPLTSDPNDPLPLTPAHFLVGRTLTSIPDPDIKGLPTNRLSQFQRIQQILQNFWSRWSKEYLSEMQQRQKWTNKTPNIKQGDLLVVKEQNLPPTKWALGRVLSVHPGADGVVRVVTIKTPNAIIKRAVAKVCMLPIND